MNLINIGNFRLHTISKFENKEFKELDIAEGLAVEKKTTNDSYYVICFVRYNKEEESAEIEQIGMRLLDIEDSEFTLFKKLIIAAKDLVEIANKGGAEQDD